MLAAAGDVPLVRELRRAKATLKAIVLAKLRTILRREGAYAFAPTPDLILLDLNLPFMHGHDFLTVVKDDPDLKRIPVIVLSSSAADSDIVASYDRHANGYITKPVSTDTYDDIVTKIESYWFSLMQLPPDGEPKQFS